MDLETPLRPLLSDLGLELYDLELAGGTLNVTVTRPGGVDLDALTAASHAVSAWLDANDPIPGRYTLDVSSPGLERKLRTPAHFASARGEVVTLRERRDGEPTRRLQGAVVDADESSVTIDDAQAGVTRVVIANVERARTVFEWGATPKPSPSRGVAGAGKG
ncbi:MAG TPA: ribosome maturation factor RimP [Acidimicrobiales bacterium]|nr:ribosome maturation factor RimP [Acidimicrobiales bacterium]